MHANVQRRRGSGAERGTPDSVMSEASVAAASTKRKAGSQLAYHYVPPAPRSSNPAGHAHACAPSLCAYVWACAECMRRVHACVVDGGGCADSRDGGGDGGRKKGATTKEETEAAAVEAATAEVMAVAVAAAAVAKCMHRLRGGITRGGSGRRRRRLREATWRWRGRARACRRRGRATAHRRSRASSRNRALVACAHPERRHRLRCCCGQRCTA